MMSVPSTIVLLLVGLSSFAQGDSTFVLLTLEDAELRAARGNLQILGSECVAAKDGVRGGNGTPGENGCHFEVSRATTYLRRGKPRYGLLLDEKYLPCTEGQCSGKGHCWVYGYKLPGDPDVVCS